MKIIHLSAHDISGGAARSAYRLHCGLRNLGHESSLLTLDKQSQDPTVVEFDLRRDPLTRLRRGLKRRFLERSWRKGASRSTGWGFFTDDRSQHNADVLRQLTPTDVVNLHWIAGVIDYGLFFDKFPRGIPLVWTLHDMNPLTGGCHHAGDCQKFEASCGACPQLESVVEDDFSRQVWNRKRSAYDSLSGRMLSLVTPSRWLGSKVQQSALTSRFPVSVIPYGLDTEIFQPRDRLQARRALGIPERGVVVLFASYFTRDKYKGHPLLVEALNRMPPIPNLHAVRVGGGESEADQTLTVPVQSLGLIKDERRMCLVYNAADLFILPSLQENFPNTALEALACGIPIVAFNVGGIPEIVRNDLTGATVRVGDSEALAKAMEGLLRSQERRGALSENCRRVAVEEYALEVQARRYAELYELVRKST